jgi:hypothetical protein
MCADYELEVLARVRMRQHHEAAQRLRNIAQAEKVARGQPGVLAGFSLANLVRLFATRRRVSVGRPSPVHEDS